MYFYICVCTICVYVCIWISTSFIDLLYMDFYFVY